MGVGYLTGQGGGGSNIKSIQRGVANMMNGVFTDINRVNVAISAIDINKSIILLSFHGEDATSANSSIMAEILSATEILFSTSQKPSYGGLFSWQVIEFNNVKSIQRGTSVIPTDVSTENITINPINLSKSFIYNTDRGTNPGYYFAGYNVRAILSESSVSLYKVSSSAQKTSHWQVIEFK